MSDDEIPTLTSVVRLGNRDGQETDAGLDELRAQIVAATEFLTDELVTTLTAELADELKERLRVRLRTELPKVMADVLKDYFNVDSH